ncbi:unnamed protein product [Peronospora farinosa]|uniref:Uncharacterized protein n=1 Tax=Peronospora farinosa TaxID=134698 RepID=A0ABN8BT17_9STRA|nr:unnamed protein product [Peronospora farinosa]
MHSDEGDLSPAVRSTAVPPSLVNSLSASLRTSLHRFVAHAKRLFPNGLCRIYRWTISPVRKPMLISFFIQKCVSSNYKLQSDASPVRHKLLAAAIALADTDVLAATHVKPSQGDDAPMERLLRSKTSADVDGEERASTSSATEILKLLTTPAESSANPSSFNNIADQIEREYHRGSSSYLGRKSISNDVPAETLLPIERLRTQFSDKDIMKSVKPDSTIGNSLLENWYKHEISLKTVQAFLKEHKLKKRGWTAAYTMKLDEHKNKQKTRW